MIDLEFKKIVCFFQRKSYDKAVEAFLEAERLSQYELPCKHVTKSEVAAKFDVSYRVLCRKIQEAKARSQTNKRSSQEQVDVLIMNNESLCSCYVLFVLNTYDDNDKDIKNTKVFFLLNYK